MIRRIRFSDSPIVGWHRRSFQVGECAFLYKERTYKVEKKFGRLYISVSINNENNLWVFSDKDLESYLEEVPFFDNGIKLFVLLLEEDRVVIHFQMASVIVFNNDTMTVNFTKKFAIDEGAA